MRNTITLSVLMVTFAIYIGAAKAEEFPQHTDIIKENSSTPQAQATPSSEEEKIADSVAAEEDLFDLSLEELLNIKISTASKSERTIERTPSIITVFTSEEIQRLGARRLIDILVLVPGFYEVSSPLERNVAIRGIHGYNAQHFVVLIDGVPVNDFLTSSSPPDQFSLDYAERVEIIRGPGSALYGANALIGVVNIITKSGNANDFYASFKGGWRNNYWLTVREEENFNEHGSLSLTLSAFINRGTKHTLGGDEDILMPKQGQNISDGIQAGENLTLPADEYDAYVNRYGPSFDLFLKYERPENWTTRLNVARYQFNPQRMANQSLYNSKEVSSVPQKSDLRILFDTEKNFGNRENLGELKLRPSFLYFNHSVSSPMFENRELDAVKGSPLPNYIAYGNEEARFIFSLEYAKKFKDVHEYFSEIELIGGVQAEYDIIFNSEIKKCYEDIGDLESLPGFLSSAKNEDTALNRALDNRCSAGFLLNEGMALDDNGKIVSDSDAGHYGDGDDVRVGAFLQYSSTFFNRLGLTLGGRLDYNPNYNVRFSPRVALAAEIYEGLYAKALYSTAFVYPAFLYRTANKFSPFEGNEDIDPQSIQTAELLLGYKYEIFRIELNGYFNQIKNFITFDEKTLVFQNRYKFTNQGELRIVGVEGNALFYLIGGKINFNLNGSWLTPLSGTTDIFDVNGKLGGPTKFPEFIGSFIFNTNPISWLWLNLSFTFSTPIEMAEAKGGFVYEDIKSESGETYSSKPLADYNTMLLLLNANIAFEVYKNLKLTLEGKNLANRTYYRPGSTLVPYLGEGLTVLGGISYRY